MCHSKSPLRFHFFLDCYFSSLEIAILSLYRNVWGNYFWVSTWSSVKSMISDLTDRGATATSHEIGGGLRSAGQWGSLRDPVYIWDSVLLLRWRWAEEEGRQIEKGSSWIGGKSEDRNSAGAGFADKKPRLWGTKKRPPLCSSLSSFGLFVGAGLNRADTTA
jgi:hypothetical protein